MLGRDSEGGLPVAAVLEAVLSAGFGLTCSTLVPRLSCGVSVAGLPATSVAELIVRLNPTQASNTTVSAMNGFGIGVF